MKGGSRRGNSVAKKLVRTLDGQPRREVGHGLVHHQIPRRRRIDPRDRLPDSHTIDRVQFMTSTCSRHEYLEQSGLIHGIEDWARQLPVCFGIRGVFLDKRTDTIDGT
jgi:hypothetical protein